MKTGQAGEKGSTTATCGPDLPSVADKVSGIGQMKTGRGGHGHQKPKSGLTCKLVIRTLEPADREPVRNLCQLLHDRTPFRSVRFSNSKFDQAFDRHLTGPRHAVCLVAVWDGTIVGIIWASAGEYFAGEGCVLTTVHLLGVDTQVLVPYLRAKTFLRLIKGIRMWSQTRNARHILVHVTTGMNLKSVDRLLRAAGGNCIGGGYVI